MEDIAVMLISIMKSNCPRDFVFILFLYNHKRVLIVRCHWCDYLGGDSLGAPDASLSGVTWAHAQGDMLVGS